MFAKLLQKTGASVRRSSILLAMLFGTFGLMLAPTAQAQSFDCAAGDITADIQSAISAPPAPGVMIIDFVGTCAGNLFIARDDVILTGAGVGVIQGNVTAHGDRIQITDLTVSGDGIVVDNGAAVRISNVTLNGSGSGNGILVQNGAVARILNNTTIKNYARGMFLSNSSTATLNGVTVKDNSNQGMFIRSSFADINNSVIENNARYGVLAQENSTVRFNNSTIEIDVAALPAGEAAVGIFRQSLVRVLGASKIENTNANGRAVYVAQQSWLRQGNGNAVIESLADAFVVSRQSGLDLRAFNVEGDIVGADKSFLNLRNGNLEGNISLRRDSDIRFLDIDGPVAVDGNLLCEDGQSRATLAAGTVINGTNDCSGFN